MKTCPKCGAVILEDAQMCDVCRAGIAPGGQTETAMQGSGDLPLHASPVIVMRNRKSALGILIAVVLVILIAIIMGIRWRQGQRIYGPGAVVVKFYASIQAKDWRALKDIIYSSTPQKQTSHNVVEAESNWVNTMQNNIRPLLNNADINKYSIEKQEINGNEATVYTILDVVPNNVTNSATYRESKPIFGLERINGQWKIIKYMIPPSTQ